MGGAGQGRLGSSRKEGQQSGQAGAPSHYPLATHSNVCPAARSPGTAKGGLALCAQAERKGSNGGLMMGLGAYSEKHIHSLSLAPTSQWRWPGLFLAMRGDFTHG